MRRGSYWETKLSPSQALPDNLIYWTVMVRPEPAFPSLYHCTQLWWGRSKKSNLTNLLKWKNKNHKTKLTVAGECKKVGSGNPAAGTWALEAGSLAMLVPALAAPLRAGKEEGFWTPLSTLRTSVCLRGPMSKGGGVSCDRLFLASLQAEAWLPCCLRRSPVILAFIPLEAAMR